MSLGFFPAWKALAFETFPEYRSLLDVDQESFVDVALFSAEYQSDQLTFTRPFLWDYEWMASDQAYALSIGSIGSKQFLIDNSLKVRQDLNDIVEFRFTYYDQSDFDMEALHHVIELDFWLHPKWAIGIYGEPSYRKSKDDFGMAILHRPVKNHEIRLFYTAVDFDRNQRNRDSDRFNRQPFASGLVGRWWSGRASQKTEFIEYAFRYEGESRWEFPDDDYEFLFFRRYSGVKLRKNLKAQSYINFSVDYRKQFQQYVATGPSPVAEDRVLFEQWQATMQYERQHVAMPVRVITGLQYADRFWRLLPGNVKHHDWLPHLWFHRLEPSSGHEISGLGLDAQIHRAKGKKSLRGDLDQKDYVVHYRMNLFKQWWLADNAALKLQFTFDLDRFGSTETWEGGNGQFIMFF